MEITTRCHIKLYRSRPKQVCAKHGLSALWHTQALIQAQFYPYMARVIVLIAYIPDKTYLISIDTHRCRNRKPLHVGIRHIIIVGSLEHIDPFKEINPDHQHHYRQCNYKAYYHFFSEYLLHMFYLLIYPL